LPRFSLLLVAMLAAATLGLAACGSSESNDYVDSVNEITSQLKEEINAIGQGSNAQDPKQASAVFAEISRKVDAAAAELADVSPPGEVADLHDRIVSDLKTLGDEAQGVADDISAGGAPAVPGSVSQFIADARRIDAEVSRTIDEINSKLQG
jgi:hypothetical protein